MVLWSQLTLDWNFKDCETKKLKNCQSSKVAKYESYPLPIKTKIKFLG